METKHTQRAETKYFNNEYENMPSLDYSTFSAPKICARNKKLLDMEVITSICDRYGFNHTFINSTFNSDAEFIVYLETDINYSQYENYRQNYSNLTKEERMDYYKLCDSHNDVIKKLHNCIHELDEQTDLMFECCWVGNVGLFGSSDVKRKSYKTARHLNGFKEITNYWDPFIYDTKSKFSKAVYVLGSTLYMKPQPQNTPLLADYEPIILNEVRNLIGSKYTADFEEGKRQYDKVSFRALVVRYKDKNEYCGMITLNRDHIGRYHITSAAPLCGEASWVMNCDDLANELKRALYFL